MIDVRDPDDSPSADFRESRRRKVRRFARRFLLYPVRRILYRRIGRSWRKSPDPILASLQSQLRRRPGVLDALPYQNGAVFMIELVVDSSMEQRRALDAGEFGVRWVVQNIGDVLCAIIVYDETQARQIASGQYLPGETIISWKVRDDGRLRT